jgi:DNA primase
MLDPRLSDIVYGIINDGDFAGTDTRELNRIFSSEHQRGKSSTTQSWETIVPPALREAMDRVRKSVNALSSTESVYLTKNAKMCAFRLKKTSLLQSTTELRFLLQEAEEAGDEVTVRQLYQRLISFTRELTTISKAIRLHG